METFGDDELVVNDYSLGSGAIATVTLNDPDGFNVMDHKMMMAMAQAIDAASAKAFDSETGHGIRCAIVRAEGHAFCAGVDIGNLGDILDEGFRREWDPFTALEECPVPFVGSVNGPAVTGGFEIALLCDVLIVGPDAIFMDNHAKYGLHPVRGLSWRLARSVGVHNARLATLASYPVDAETALRWGLAQKCVSAEELDGEALEIAKAIAANHPLMVSRYRELHKSNIRGGSIGAAMEEQSDSTFYDQLDDVDATVSDGANKFLQLLESIKADKDAEK